MSKTSNIREIRKSRKMTIEQLADATGLSVSFISLIERGKSGITVDNLNKFAKALGVRVRDLLIDVQQSSETPEAGAFSDDKAASRPGLKGGPKPPPDRPASKRIPVYGTATTDGRLLMTGEIVDEVFCPPSLVNVPGVYAVHVWDDSMAPRYLAGETVWVHPSRPVPKGEWVVVQIKGPSRFREAIIRQFVGWDGDELVVHQLKPPGEKRFARDQVASVHPIIMSARN